jgi:hypothetical protein
LTYGSWNIRIASQELAVAFHALKVEFAGSGSSVLAAGKRLGNCISFTSRPIRSPYLTSYVAIATDSSINAKIVAEIVGIEKRSAP